MVLMEILFSLICSSACSLDHPSLGAFHTAASPKVQSLQQAKQRAQAQSRMLSEQQPGPEVCSQGPILNNNPCVGCREQTLPYICFRDTDSLEGFMKLASVLL